MDARGAVALTANIAALFSDDAASAGQSAAGASTSRAFTAALRHRGAWSSTSSGCGLAGPDSRVQPG
jgi:hypothetical protein